MERSIQAAPLPLRAQHWGRRHAGSVVRAWRASAPVPGRATRSLRLRAQMEPGKNQDQVKNRVSMIENEILRQREQIAAQRAAIAAQRASLESQQAELVGQVVQTGAV